jgi:DNA mismatch repair protein MutS
MNDALYTNLRKQYDALKSQYPDAVLLFLVGDFCELYFDDAVHASNVLGITLMTRSKGGDPIPMAGFPRHALEGHLRKLLTVGKVAVCEQVADVPKGKPVTSRRGRRPEDRRQAGVRGN